MTIDRRNFVTGVALTAMVPGLPLLPALPPTLATELSRLVLRIDGWSDPAESGALDVAWIRIGHSWRTAWR
jgi:hypothetical protein